jgi:hypothetical protein
LQRRRASSEQARRDAEWRSLVRAVTKPNGVVSDVDEARFRDYLDRHMLSNGSSPNGAEATRRERVPDARDALGGDRRDADPGRREPT